MTKRKRNRVQIKTENLPQIPDKIYFGIKEVSELCDLKTHVLRYWEQEFPQLKPMKGQGNRRHYQRKDILLIRRIRWLLYEEGYTIEGARQQLNQPSKEKSSSDSTRHSNLDVKALVSELQKVLTLLKPGSLSDRS